MFLDTLLLTSTLKKTPHLTVKRYREASFPCQQIVRRPTDNQLSLSCLPSSDLIGPVRLHQWQHQAAALITAVRMKEARLMSSDRGMCTRDLDKKQGSIIAPRLPVSANGVLCEAIDVTEPRSCVLFVTCISQPSDRPLSIG